jgi:hypothetical protein
LQPTPLPGVDYQYTYLDVPEERRLTVKVISTSKRQICVGRDTWPRSGQLATNTGTSTGVYLFVQKRIYAYRSTDHWGYCSQKSCYGPLDQGQALEGYVSYEGFELPESDYLLTKELKYKPQPFWCDLGRFIGN